MTIHPGEHNLDRIWYDKDENKFCEIVHTGEDTILVSAETGDAYFSCANNNIESEDIFHDEILCRLTEVPDEAQSSPASYLSDAIKGVIRWQSITDDKTRAGIRFALMATEIHEMEDPPFNLRDF
jgi:hypothetical protein